MPTNALTGRYKDKYIAEAVFEENKVAKIAWPENEANAESSMKLRIFCSPSVIIGKREITASQVVRTFGLVIITSNACQKAELKD